MLFQKHVKYNSGGMAGHSKWAQIKRKKGIKDQEKGTVFTKLSKLISLAVSTGGGITNPDLNIKLRLAIDKAKTANMPKDTIERAIQKGAGPGKDSLKEMVYEGFGPEGTGFIVHATTDNSNRTYAEIRMAFDKNGGKLGVPGSLQYLFKIEHTPEFLCSPLFPVEVKSEQSAEEIVSLMSALETLEDVQQVFTNVEFNES